MAKFRPWVAAGDHAVSVSGGPTPNPKKVTGSRLGAILGLNKWKSEFGAWCEICRVAEPPFEGNKYTQAGEVIEPKLIEWAKRNVSPYIYTPEEWFGKNKSQLGYDHFHDEPVLGGMWDGIVLDGPKDKGGVPIGIVEAKTSSRPQDWHEGDVPDNYGIQGLSYAYLLGVDRAYFPVRFMEKDEYDDPASCECTEDNTFCYETTVTGTLIRDKSVPEWMDVVSDWYERHVVANISPVFDEKRDKEYLSIMRRNEVVDEGLQAYAEQASVLAERIEALRVESGLKELEKELKALKDKQIKPALVEQFTDNDEVVAAHGWQVKRGTTESVDKEALKKDGVFDKYVTTKPRYTLTPVKGD